MYAKELGIVQLFATNPRDAARVLRGHGNVLFGPIAGSSERSYADWGPIPTDTSAQIQYYQVSVTGSLYVRTRGWIDRRGK